MISVAEIVAQAFNAVAAKIGGVIHTATVDGVEVGRLVQDVKGAASTFTAKRDSAHVYTAYCDFAPAIGDVLTYAGEDHLVFWVQDALAAGGMWKASVFPISEMMATAVEFQERTRTDNGAGGYTEAWAAINGAETAAYVRAVSGNERMASGRVEAQATHRIVCRYFAGLAENDRVVIGGRAYNLTFVDDWEKRSEWLVVDAVSGAAS